MPVCGKAAAGGGPCQRPVMSAGGPCGVDHPAVVSPTGAPPSGTFGPGGGPPADPLTVPPVTAPWATVTLAAVAHAIEVDDVFGCDDEWTGVWDDLAGLDPLFSEAASAARAAGAQHRQHLEADDPRYDLSPADHWRTLVDVDALRARVVELAGRMSAEDVVTAAESDAAAARCFAVMNGSLPAGLLERLAGDDDWEVRFRVAGSSSCPPEALARLAGDPDEDIRAEVARNPNTPPGTLLSLAADPSPVVRGTASSHPSCPPAGRAASGLLAD